MKELILVLIPIVISGLGFLSYKHPPISRKILFPLNFIIAGIFFIIMMYYMVTSNAYYNAKDVVRSSFDTVEYQTKDISYSNIKDKDSLLIAKAEQRCETDKYFEIQKVKLLTSRKIQDELGLIIESNSSIYKEFLLYCVLAFIITNVLYGLSFLFDNIHDKVNENNNNKPV
jgi:hypothetical protein